MKTCSKCGEIKPLDEYQTHSEGKFGRRPDCKSCCKARKRAYYEQHRESVLESTREYARKNSEAVRLMHQKAHRRRSEDPEWLDQKRAKEREYGRTHKAERSIRQRKRLDRLAAAPVNDFTKRQWQMLKESYGNRCAYCGIESKRLQTDHVIPLCHRGPHTARNIVPSCGPCNQRKGAGPALPYHVIPAFFVA